MVGALVSRKYFTYTDVPQVRFESTIAAFEQCSVVLVLCVFRVVM